MILEKQLNKNMLNEISAGIERAKNQSIHFTTTHENIIASLANLYTNTISTLRPRIMVQGEQVYLRNSDTAGKIRPLLLAGIRAAVLWHQLGGSKWKLVFSRKKYAITANQLLLKV